MADSARERILARLRRAAEASGRPVAGPPAPPPAAAEPRRTTAERIEQLAAHMRAVRTEVVIAPSAEWPACVRELLARKGVRRLLYAPGTPVGDAVAGALAGAGSDELPQPVPYDADVERLKDTLFEVDAAVTGTLGAVADTGALILWPDEREPRLMSLVPPLHVAVLSAGALYDSLEEAMAKGGWAQKMPTNALLISGPSKTADIELTLAFGVHGPRELVVVIIDHENT